MHVRHQRDGAAIDLLGIGRVHAIGPEARFDVGDRDPAIEGGQSGGEGGAGVALDENPVGRGFGQHPVDPPDRSREECVQCLVPLHQSQVEIGVNIEETKHLIE